MRRDERDSVATDNSPKGLRKSISDVEAALHSLQNDYHRQINDLHKLLRDTPRQENNHPANPQHKTDHPGESAPWQTTLSDHPRRSPKTGQWWSPENRPMRKRSGHNSDVRNTLRQCEQCLEREKKKKQIITLGQRLLAAPSGLKATGVRRETAAGYLKAAGIAVGAAGRLGPAGGTFKTGQ